MRRKEIVVEKCKGKMTIMQAEFFNVTALIDAFAAMETQNLRVDIVNVSPRMYSNFRKLGRDILDVETLLGNLKKGIMGVIWGAQIRIDKSIPEDTILLKSEKEFGPVIIKLVVKSTSKSIAQVISDLADMNNKLLDLRNTLEDIMKTLGRAKELK
jgi:hypothetical protein